MPKQQKLSPEEKVTIIHQILGGQLGMLEAERLFGVNHKSIQLWIVQYEAEGVAAFLPRERTRTYSEDLKLQAVTEYLHGNCSQMEICKKYKIHATTQLRHWIKVYNAHGNFSLRKRSGGGSYMSETRITTQEERLQIAKECIANGKNYGEIALRHKVSYQQVRVWTLRYEELGEAGLEDRRGQRKRNQTPRTPLEEAQIEIERLKHELHKAEMERDLLKKLDKVMRRDAYRK